MQFRTLQLENFKSFRKLTNFTFSDEIGLYFLTGRNDIEPELGANGAGKSSLLDALVWVLYGKTARGVKASNVRSWGSTKQCHVACEFDIGDATHTIERTWGPNSLKLNERDVEQEEIDKLLNLTPEEFNYSIFASQFGQMFFDLTPSEKLSVFTDIMALEVWTDRSSKASKKAKELDAELRDVQSSVDRNQGELEALESELVRNQEASTTYEKQRAADLKGLEQHHTELCTKHDKIIDQLEETAYHQSEQPEPESTEELEIQINKLVATLKTNDIKLGQFNTKQKILEEELNKFDSVIDTCPYCKQQVSELHISEEIKKLREQRAKIEKLIKKLKSSHKKTSAECEALEEGLEMIEGSNSRRSKIKLEHEQQIAMLEQQLSDMSSKIDRQEKDIKVLEKKPDPYAALIDRTTKRQEQLAKEQNELKKDIDELRQSLEGMQFWAKGFKDLRLFLVEEALTQLEVEINNNLLQLGLRDWSIKLDVERETASGGVAKGFHVAVQSPYNPKPVPWAVWSGGESQRLRLAGTMGLADLILSRKGIDCNVEIYDEPTAHLSQSGIEDLLDSLYHRAIERQKQIILVDHRSLQFGSFASTTTIVKDKEGSHVVV